MTLAFLSETHIIAHIVILATFLAGIFRLTPMLGTFVNFGWLTRVFGGGFFLFSAMTHFANATGHSESLLFAITDHLLAIAIVGFMALLTRDVFRAAQRLSLAFAAIRIEYGKEVGDTVEATIAEALGRSR